MKAWSVSGLLFAAAIFATIPMSAQVTPRGLELSVDGAKALTYGHARRVQRRMARREFRHERRAVSSRLTANPGSNANAAYSRTQSARSRFFRRPSAPATALQVCR